MGQFSPPLLIPMGAVPPPQGGVRGFPWMLHGSGAGGFPFQYAGLRIRNGAVTLELCMVATADAPIGMGWQLRIRRTADTLAVYLVETTDPNASAVRIQTGTGIKAVRLKT